jgi:hypothetical protein
MGVHSKQPPVGIVTTFVMQEDTHAAVHALCKAGRTSMRAWIGSLVERELQRVAREGV